MFERNLGSIESARNKRALRLAKMKYLGYNNMPVCAVTNTTFVGWNEGIHKIWDEIRGKIK